MERDIKAADRQSHGLAPRTQRVHLTERVFGRGQGRGTVFGVRASEPVRKRMVCFPGIGDASLF